MSVLVQPAGYVGDYLPTAVVYFKFFVTDAVGAPTTLGGTPVVKVYKNDADGTETTTGVTLTADFDSKTGLCQVAVDTSADGTFYAAGNDFEAVITTGTVGAVSAVGTPVGHFSLSNRPVVLADGVAHGGTPGSSTATLAMLSVNVTNDGGDAVKFESTGGDGFSISSSSGYGVKVMALSDAFSLSSELASGFACNAGDAPAVSFSSNVTGMSITGSGGHDISLDGALGDIWSNANDRPVSVHLAGDIEHGGDTATLTLKGVIVSSDSDPALYIANSGGDAVKFESTGGDGRGLVVIGNGTGPNTVGLGRVQKNAALSNFEFVMTDSTDHAPVTGKSVTATVSIDGGAFASCANSASEVSDGVYKIDLADTDLNGDVVTLRFSGTGCDDTFVTIVTQP